MKLFIDTANILEIQEVNQMGILSGVTTNPTLISREIKRTNKTYKEIISSISKMVNGDISAEVTALDTEGMIKEALQLKELGSNIVIKIPITLDGLKAIKRLTKLGIKTNATLCFSALQAWLVAEAGATYVSPFVGRLDDIAQDGMQLVDDITQIYTNYNYQTEVLVASIRHPVHILQAAKIGADVVTIPFKVITKLLKHPKTDEGLQRFLDDIKKVKGTI